MFGTRHEDGTPLKYALLTGGEKGLEAAKEADLVFATMQTLSKPHILEHFGPRAFDVICEDEAHHTGAESYRSIHGLLSARNFGWV